MTYSTLRSLLVLLATSALAMQVNAQVTDAGPDTSLCVNYYTMQGSPLPPGATGQWVLYMGCGTFTDPTSPTTLVTDLCTGYNLAGWTVDDNGTITSDVVEIIVFDAAMANANAGPDTITVIAPQSSAFLSGSPTPIYPATCWWSWIQGSGVVTDPNDPNSSVFGLTIGGDILLWTCDNGPCGTTSDTLVIQMMLSTGLVNMPLQGAPTIVYDPISHQIRVREAALLDALDGIGMDGRAILHASGGYHSISTADMPAGLYIARSIHGDEVRTLRFVVAR